MHWTKTSPDTLSCFGRYAAPDADANVAVLILVEPNYNHNMSDMNPRAARSRDAILEAFRQLMREKDYDKITVRDIFKRAGVGNGTFYRHFSDKEDLLTYAATLDLAGVYEAMEGAGSPYNESAASFRYIAEHPEMFRAILNLNVSDPLHRRVADAMCAR